MNWILVVLQYTAVTAGTYAVGWTPLAELKTNEACVAASKQLVQSQAATRYTSVPSKFECIDKGVK